MKWISVEEQLPKNGQAVLIRRSDINWLMDHTLSDGKQRGIWRWQAAEFVKGRKREDILDGTYHSEDQYFNNLKPYRWKLFGPGGLFGQEVSHWAAIDPTELD